MSEFESNTTFRNNRDQPKIFHNLIFGWSYSVKTRWLSTHQRKNCDYEETGHLIVRQPNTSFKKILRQPNQEGVSSRSHCIFFCKCLRSTYCRDRSPWTLEWNGEAERQVVGTQGWQSRRQSLDAGSVVEFSVTEIQGSLNSLVNKVFIGRRLRFFFSCSSSLFSFCWLTSCLFMTSSLGIIFHYSSIFSCRHTDIVNTNTFVVHS